MFYQIFPSPSVKQCAIITYKHGMYERSSHTIALSDDTFLDNKCQFFANKC